MPLSVKIDKYYTMRDLINTIQLLSEDQTLSPATIVKYSERFKKFLEMIRKEMTFYDVNRQPVIIDPTEADRIQNLFDKDQFAGTITLKLKDGNSIALGKLLKTKDLGGQAQTGEEGEETGKEAALLKPSQIDITDKDIPASDLGKEIINNPVLLSTDYGKIVIELAKNIMQGLDPIIPKDVPPKIKSSIIDYAGEYLGVLALVNGRSRFPRRTGFEQWLGSDVGSLIVNFPSKANNNIADSFASVKNKKTNHTINISSKGKGGGAPPSLGGLKIPDEIRNNPEYQAVIDFIDLTDPSKMGRFSLPEPKTISQVFQAMNLLYEYYPKSIPEKFMPFLPWKKEIINQVTTSMADFKKGRDIKNKTLNVYKKLWSDIDFKKSSSFGGKLTHVVKLAVMKAVNEGNALPEFQTVVLAILDMNFIQQYTNYDVRSGKLLFSTQWPAKLEGNISLESKSGATDPTKGGFSFKLSDSPPKTSLEEPEETPDEVAPATVQQPKTDYDFISSAERIAKGKSTNATKTTPSQDLGRKERKSR